MGKFDDCIEVYEGELKKLGITYKKDLLVAVAKSCGPSLYRADASKVSSSDKEELARVKKNFIAKKLGVTDEAKADKAIAAAIEKFGKGNRNKYRAIFYMFVAKELRKASMFTKK
jgi:hypothetical protein